MVQQWCTNDNEFLYLQYHAPRILGKDRWYKRMGAALTTGLNTPVEKTCDGTKKKKARPGVRKRRQRGGILPLLPLAIPGLICGRESISVRRCRSRGRLRRQKRNRSCHPTIRSTLSIKGTCPKSEDLLIMSWHIRRQLQFRWSILKAADHQTRRKRLQSANADQIKALSQLVINTLRGQIFISLSTLTKLRPHQQALREMTRRKHSLKKRGQIMMSQQGHGLWQGLNTACNHCLRG